MTDIAELVQRLRKLATEPWKHDGSVWPDRVLEAADALEAQAKRIAELEAVVKAVADLEPDLPFYIWGQINNAVPSKARPSKALKPPQENGV